ncbi:hypothetical protein L3X38_013553 [Prunus dulcis]|uniref:No apical meristem-associated C-terminal domain-containing protein n=1 Tax=Prunus dulcis TaxID=3755 RepID=A0AAD4WNY2_PRUDU|nr:hypothetical protein L3X38_013553 [Prunus dulcis]
MASSVEIGGSWSTQEDIALCESWVNVSHDPITGNEMKFHHMWSKIHGEFCQRSGSIRTEMALSSRWKILNKELGKWRNALTKASENIRSGANLSDEIQMLGNCERLCICVCPHSGHDDDGVGLIDSSYTPPLLQAFPPLLHLAPDILPHVYAGFLPILSVASPTPS